MDAKYATALEESIARWERLAMGDADDAERTLGPEQCALCVESMSRHGGYLVCEDCPVKTCTGKGKCDDTPYYDAADADEDHGQDSAEFRRAALAERDFLISLREPEKQETAKEPEKQETAKEPARPEFRFEDFSLVRTPEGNVRLRYGIRYAILTISPKGVTLHGGMDPLGVSFDLDPYNAIRERV